MCLAILSLIAAQVLVDLNSLANLSWPRIQSSVKGQLHECLVVFELRSKARSHYVVRVGHALKNLTREVSVGHMQVYKDPLVLFRAYYPH